MVAHSGIFRPWEDKVSDEESTKKKHPIPKYCALECKREYKRQLKATRHCHPTEKCPDCGKAFTRKDNLTRHRKMKHDSDEKPTCKFCSKSLSRKDAVQRHEGTCHSNPNRHPSPSSSSGVIRARNSEGPNYSEVLKPIPLRIMKLEYPRPYTLCSTN